MTAIQAAMIYVDDVPIAGALAYLGLVVWFMIALAFAFWTEAQSDERRRGERDH